MKVIDTKPGELALQLNQNEVLEESIVTEAFVHFGASERRANELTEEFFYAIKTLLEHKQEVQRTRRRAGLKLVEWHKKQKELKTQSPLKGG